MTRILIVEDDALIALGLCQTIEDELGAETCVAASVAAADKIVGVTRPDFALLDVNLRHETSYAFARRLIAAGIPFAFTSGSRREDVPSDLTGAEFLTKPATTQRLVSVIRTSLTPLRNGTNPDY